MGVSRKKLDQGFFVKKIKSGRPCSPSLEKLPSHIPSYEGYLDVSKCSKEVTQAVNSFSQQKNRCRFVGHPRYKGYGNYEFSNIIMQDKSDNAKEMTDRRGPPTAKKSIVCLDYPSMEPLMLFSSSIEASKFTDVKGGNIRTIAIGKGQSKSGKGFTFRYL